MDRLRFGVLLGLCLVTLALEARPLTAADVPKPLEPWVGWVLQGHEERTCPFLYNSFEHHRCAWPTQLELELSQREGTFVQRWDGAIVSEGILGQGYTVQLQELNLHPADFHGQDRNYSIRPRQSEKPSTY